MASVLSSSWLSGWGAPSKQEQDWTNDLAEAQLLLRDIAIDLQDREAKFRRGADAARLTAGIRRKTSTAAARLERLELESLPQLTLAVPEASRRREVLARMRSELEQLNARLSGGHTGIERAALFGTQVGAPGRVGAAHVPGRGYAESDATAGLDNGQLVLQQRDFMKQQDSRLEDICATVGALKRTSLAINEELSMQTGLMDSFGRDVERTHAQLRKVEQKSAHLAGTRSQTLQSDTGAPPEKPTWAEATSDNCCVQ